MIMTKGGLRRSLREEGFVTALGGVKWFAASGFSDERCLCRSFLAYWCLALYHLHSNLDREGVLYCISPHPKAFLCSFSRVRLLSCRETMLAITLLHSPF